MALFLLNCKINFQQTIGHFLSFFILFFFFVFFFQFLFFNLFVKYYFSFFYCFIFMVICAIGEKPFRSFFFTGKNILKEMGTNGINQNKMGVMWKSLKFK